LCQGGLWSASSVAGGRSAGSATPRGASCCRHGPPLTRRHARVCGHGGNLEVLVLGVERRRARAGLSTRAPVDARSFDRDCRRRPRRHRQGQHAAFRKLTTVVDGVFRSSSDPPVLVRAGRPAPGGRRERAPARRWTALASIEPSLRRTGAGCSRATPSWTSPQGGRRSARWHPLLILLLEGAQHGPRSAVLQSRRPSVRARPFAGASEFDNHGRRVVEAAADAGGERHPLGWLHTDGTTSARDFYGRSCGIEAVGRASTR